LSDFTIKRISIKDALVRFRAKEGQNPAFLCLTARYCELVKQVDAAGESSSVIAAPAFA